MSSSKAILEEMCGHNEERTFCFTVSPADPCLVFKENELGICIIMMYVDDMLMIGKNE